MGKRYERQVGEIVSSTPFARAPYPSLTRSPFPIGEGSEKRMLLFSHCQSEYTHMWKKQYRRTKPSPRETGRGIHFSFTNFHLSMI